MSETSSENISQTSSYIFYIIITILIIIIIIIISFLFLSNTTNKTKLDTITSSYEAKIKNNANTYNNKINSITSSYEEKLSYISRVRIQINKNKSNALQISQLVLLDINNNIIKPIEINASEPYPLTNKNIANDGVREARPYPKLYHSGNDSITTAFYEFIIIPTKIKSIEIYNRTDCCSDRLKDFSLYLIDAYNNIIDTFPLSDLPKQVFTVKTK